MSAEEAFEDFEKKHKLHGWLIVFAVFLLLVVYPCLWFYGDDLDRKVRVEMCGGDPVCTRLLEDYCQDSDRECYELILNRAKKGELDAL